MRIEKSGTIAIVTPHGKRAMLNVYAADGRRTARYAVGEGECMLRLPNAVSGIYLLELTDSSGVLLRKQKAVFAK